MTAHFKLPPIRSRKVLDYARGQPCCFRFPGVCNGNWETTVSCHIHDRHRGMGTKASDISIIFGCSSCHDLADGRRPRPSNISEEDVLRTIIRGLQETWEALVHGRVINVPLDPEPPPMLERSIKPRKPKEQRAKIAGASKWAPAGSRKIQSANNLRKKPT
ncbi:MAG: DUF1364 family protein [Devosia sp.]|nr:DUF1364 family protein [Devosia sp.]